MSYKDPAHVSNITALHHAQFSEYSSPSTMVTISGAESAPPRGKEDILKAVGIRVKSQKLEIYFENNQLRYHKVFFHIKILL